jgi:hypothetical protein
MFAAGKTAAVSGAGPDDKFNYVTMLLHGDGTNGAQNNTFVDSSTNNFTITRNGNTTQGSFSPYGSNWSNYFNGDPTRLSLATATALGTGNVTVEFWFNTPDTSATYYALYDGRSAANTNTGFGIFQYGQTIEIYGNGLKVSSAASAFTANTWNHFAVVRTSGTCQIYINGVASGSSASYSDDFTSTTRSIGRNSTAGNFYTGYISNLREVTSALYSGTFTPSTTPLTAVSGTTLLTCQSNRFIDNSTNAYAITVTGTPSVQRFNPFGASTAYSTSVIGGSGYFDGSDYLTGPTNNAAFQFGTGDFTIEMWVYTANLSAYQTLLEIRSADSLSPYGLFIDNTGKPYLYDASGIQASSIGVTANAWTHLAFVRTSGTFKIFVNGTSGYSASNTNSEDANGLLKIGDNFSSGAFYLGYLSNYRIVKGTAVYTSNFTPPTSPLTAISGTSLLLNFTNGAIFDNAMMNDLETVGNAQISTSVVKYGTGSMSFDGTGDWLLTQNNLTIGFGTGDFTVEFWINPTNWSNTYAGVIGGQNTNSLWIGKNTSNFVLRASNNTDLVSYGTMPTTGTWTHIAITRSGTTARMFYDGTQVASATTGHNFVNAAFYIGQDGGGNAFTGYLDDMRITKGYARYTANFTPPTAAFSNTGPI